MRFKQKIKIKPKDHFKILSLIHVAVMEESEYWLYEELIHELPDTESLVDTYSRDRGKS